MRRLLITLALTIGLIQAASADTFPSRPITIIVPYGPGGGTDLFARVLASSLGSRLGQSIVIDNVPGAGGTIGIQKLNNARSDGYTLIVASGMEYEMQALSNPDAPVRTTDLKAIGNFGTQPMVLVARPGLGVKTVDEFVALAKSKPGKISMAAVGPGTALQITGLMIQQAAAIQLIDVPYKGSGSIVTDILAGNVDVAIMSPPTVHGLVREGKLIPLAVSEAARSPVMPGVPSLSETAAFKNIDTKIGYPLYGPKSLPQPVAELLVKRANEIQADPQFQQALLKLMVAPTKRIAAEDADALNASQLAQFKAALAGKPAAK
ncbi:Bug family tripartite tricarboxylate transporter substrate binding protein [Variovorax atrisoli]|uniref:Bug family tripartite tricarboxylate transporter substrate binding protein n=1 Tax=Variovorax atrisoli TaxID=3394203 RepID=UPI0033938954